MNVKSLIAASLLAASLITLSACKGDDTPKVPTNTTPIVNNTEVTSDIPTAYLMQMNKLLSEWELREGSMSDPLIGTRLLMYDNTKKAVKTKDEIGFLLIDLDGDGTEELITAPIDGFTSNAMVYDILTIKDGTAFHLANSLEATYHLMADNSFILRTPNADKTAFTFKRVTINGSERPTEIEITKEESAKYYISVAELTPFSALEK